VYGGIMMRGRSKGKGTDVEGGFETTVRARIEKYCRG
jgi:hypothetical protein